MRIAEDLVKSGVTISTGFGRALEALVANNKLTRIIETGTYHGTGTTQAIISGLEIHDLESEFYSIECNPDFHRIASKNLSFTDKVNLINGISIPKSKLPSLIDFTDYPDHIIVDYKPEIREKMYLAEVKFDVPDDILGSLLVNQGFEPELVVLDSAGHMGTVEFDYLMTLIKNDFLLALDDTNHVKHYKTVQKITGDERFKEVWKSSDKFGSAIYKVRLS